MENVSEKMKKILTLAMTLTVVIGCIVNSGTVNRTARTPSFNSQEELIEIIDAATIALVEKNEDNDFQVTCGGIWITQYQFISAFHCVSDIVLPSIEISSDGMLIFKEADETMYVGKTVSYVSSQRLKRSDRQYHQPIDVINVSDAIIIATDRDHDLVMIQTVDHFDAIIHQALPVRKPYNELLIGERVHILGHTAGYPFTYINGVVSAERDSNGPFKKKIHVIQINASVWFGNSGGAAFDMNGNIVGIASFIRKDVPNMSFFIHFNVINQFIEKNEKLLATN